MLRLKGASNEGVRYCSISAHLQRYGHFFHPLTMSDEGIQQSAAVNGHIRTALVPQELRI